ncbi:MAG: tetratricopeptide repeat protein, partial [Planctomycetota bacterium]
MRTILSKAVNQLTGETLAGQVADFCSTVSEKGPEAAIAGLLGTAAGPIGTVLGVAAVFGGSLWLERRSERAAEEKLKQHFAEIAEALAQADIDRAAAFEKLDRIYERKTFVWARFDFKHVDDILARYRDKLYAGRTPGEILDDLGDTLQGIAVVTTDTNERMRDVQDELASMRALLESFAADKNPQADPREREIPDDVLEAARVLAERGDATDKARAAIVERDFAEADRQLDKLDPVVREAFDVLTLRGDRLYSEGRFDEAVDPYEKAFALNSDDPTARHNLAVTHTQARQGDIAAHKKRAIDIHIGTLRQQALGSVKWAGTQNNLGLAWRNIPTGDRGANLDKAIAAFESALEVYTRAAHPVDWAMTQNNLGTAWSDMPTGDRGENFGKAIAAYASALEVYTRTSHPVEWAVTQNNLGVAWQDMPTDDRGANLGKAIAAYESALEVRNRTADPEEWAATPNNLGIA